MFITAIFRDVMWRPQERGACVIIDDPLLKRRYGFCDFTRLRDDMRRHDFTTNIAFIPWNWRRTTRSGGELFRRNPDVFSVSIHGCDHVKAEFGMSSTEAIDTAASLAQTRMRRHQDRTNIRHEPVMVFPQGVFSSICPGSSSATGSSPPSIPKCHLSTARRPSCETCGMWQSSGIDPSRCIRAITNITALRTSRLICYSASRASSSRITTFSATKVRGFCIWSQACRD